MTVRRFDDFEAGVEEFIESQDNTNLVNLATKLERRRRIEELEEERRLREELCEY
jgi:hypothetical protein